MQPRTVTVSEDEYFRLDAESEEKLEYWYGHIVAMAGEQRNHAVISHNALRILEGQRPDCLALTSSLRVRAPGYGRANYAYPDVLLICGEEQYDETRNPPTLLNPTLLIEVMSDSTKGYDLDDKLHAYLRVDSVAEYWILDATRPYVRRCTRFQKGYLVEVYDGPDAVLVSEALALRVPVRDFYERVF